MISGAQPATAMLFTCASTSSLCFAAYSSVQTSVADAPSVSGDDVPAVTLPSASNAGASPASASAVVSGRMQPSSLTVLPSASTIGTISSLSLPAARAAAAFWCDATANLSCSARVTWYLRARFSAVWPIEIYAAGYSFASLGLGEGLNPVIGTRVMLSMPAQIKASPASIWIAPAAMWIDCIDEPQNRLTVVPATVIGSFARNATSRAMLRPCSPSGMAQPMI